MRLPATPGWVWLLVVVGVPRHSLLRAPGAVPRHSWLGDAGGGGVVSGRLPLLAAGPGRGSPPLLAEGLGGGSPPLLAGVRRPWRWVFPRLGCHIFDISLSWTIS